jgi:hypothetical protein
LSTMLEEKLVELHCPSMKVEIQEVTRAVVEEASAMAHGASANLVD